MFRELGQGRRRGTDALMSQPEASKISHIRLALDRVPDSASSIGRCPLEFFPSASADLARASYCWIPIQLVPIRHLAESSYDRIDHNLLLCVATEHAASPRIGVRR